MAFKFGRFSKDTGGVTPEEIKSIVNREVNAASTKTQMIKYFDNIAASSERAETMLVEIKDAMDENDEKFRMLEELSCTMKEVAASCGNLETVLHKDNLITYKNIKDRLDAIEEDNDTKIKKIKGQLAVTTVFAIISLAGIAFLIVKSLGLI